MPRLPLRLALLASISLLLSCSGDRQVVKSPTIPRGLAVVEGGLEPSIPLALERAVAWALVRDGTGATVHLAHVDSTEASQPGFVPSAELFESVELVAVGETDSRGQRRFEIELPPRPVRRILYYWFEGSDDAGERRRLPESAPEGAIPVGSSRFDIDFEWPGWSEPFGGLECWADASLFDIAHATTGPNFDEIIEPIWVPIRNATVMYSWVGSQQGVGIVVGGQAYFYPLNIMIWNEMANAQQGGLNTVLSYCPLTDSAMSFSHENTGKFRKFQTGGLFNSNLMIGDPVEPRSLVPQMLGFGVTGIREGECADVLPSFLCNASFWQAMYPESLALNGDTRLAEDWNWMRLHNPYEHYWRNNAEIRAPLAREDTEHPLGLQNKDVVVGVFGMRDQTVFPVHRPAPGGVIVHNDAGGSIPLLFVWLQRHHFGAVFDRRHPETGALLSFRRAQASFRGGELLEDLSEEPSLWNATGLAISGPHKGTQLAWIPSMRVFWFAWYATYPDSRIVDLPTAEEG